MEELLLLCSIMFYPSMEVTIRIDEGYNYGYFWWNTEIITMQRYERDVLQHELTHLMMKKLGWSLYRSQQHDHIFDATQEYVRGRLRCQRRNKK